MIAIFLSILLAGGSWQAAHAPQYETGFVQDIVVISKDPPIPTAKNQPIEINTAIPGALRKQPEIGLLTTATPVTGTDSCANGPVGSGTFVWPTDNHSLSGKDYGTSHPGIDIAAGEGSPVYAADAGVVIALGNDIAGYGNVIQIDHGNGYLTVYAHLREIGVQICQGVYTGQWIGSAGSTGNARGAHLHFEIARDGWHINPWDVLP